MEKFLGQSAILGSMECLETILYYSREVSTIADVPRPEVLQAHRASGQDISMKSAEGQNAEQNNQVENCWHCSSISPWSPVQSPPSNSSIVTAAISEVEMQTQPIFQVRKSAYLSNQLFTDYSIVRGLEVTHHL